MSTPGPATMSVGPQKIAPCEGNSCQIRRVCPIRPACAKPPLIAARTSPIPIRLIMRPSDLVVTAYDRRAPIVPTGARDFAEILPRVRCLPPESLYDDSYGI